MRKFDSKKYKELVEDWNDPIIKKHEGDELKLIKSIPSLKQRTIVDLGAGYGRVVPRLINYVRNIVAIEINPEMFSELERRSKRYKNIKVEAILGDITNLSETIKNRNIITPVFIILENTLGTIEGDYKQVLREIKSNAKYYKGDIVLSLYRQRALRDWGIMTYVHGREMNGEPDLENTDFNKGFFTSRTGYTSKWWTDEEIEGFKSFFGGKLLQEVKEDQYWIFQSSYKYI